jgi:HNH endonuclease
MTAAELACELLIAPLLLLGAALLHGPSGYLAVLVPRRRRAAYRYRLAHRRWRRRPRGSQKSGRVPRRLERRVMFADRHRCVWCGDSRAQAALRDDSLQVDHMIPWSWGGLTCLWNSAVLCGRDNKIKGTVFTDRGRVRGKQYGQSGSRADGARIYRRELRNRCSPRRCARSLLAVLAVR